MKRLLLWIFIMFLSFVNCVGKSTKVKTVTVDCNVTFSMNEDVSNYEGMFPDYPYDVSGELPTFEMETVAPISTEWKWSFSAVWNDSANSSALYQASRLCESVVGLMEIGNVSKEIQNEIYTQIFYSSKGGKTDMECFIADSPYDCKGMHPSDRNDLSLLFNPKRAGTNQAAQILSTLACSISVVFFALTIAAQLLSRDRRRLSNRFEFQSKSEEAKKKAPMKILIGLCATVMVAMIVFLAGATRTENHAACIAITFILHYFYLASWCWMSVYSYDIYVSLVKVFTDHRWYLQKISAFAYGTPLIVAAITIASTNTKDVNSPDSYRSPSACWLNSDALRYGFTLPVGIMLLINLVILAVVLWELHRMNAKVKSPLMKYTAKQSMLVAVTMTTMNGALWVSGLLISVSKDQKYQDIMSWTFMICNAFQGLTVFLLTCVRPVATRQAWMREISHLLCKERSDHVYNSEKGSRTNTLLTYVQTSNNSPAPIHSHTAKNLH